MLVEKEGKDLPVLIVMVGLQCSGKSTKAKKFAFDYGAEILSSDEYREKHPDWDNEKVFKNIYADMNSLLKDNISVIIDATNTTVKSRKQIFNNLRTDCVKNCYIMNTPIEECRKRLEERNNSEYSNKIPVEALERYHKSFEIPFMDEGWDFITVNHEPEYEHSCEWQDSVLNIAKDFDQHNMHHTKNLLDHMQDVGNRTYTLLQQARSDAKEYNTIVTLSGYWHDIGKLYTQTYKDEDPNAHYYNHANVGAYSLLCNSGIYEAQESPIDDEPDWIRYNIDKTLEWLFYVNYHMHMYNLKTEKSISKWKRIFGETKYNYLEILNKADKGEH